MKKQVYKCRYCSKKIHRLDYEINNGYCGKCKEVMDWKRTLSDLKDLEK
jgi:hypothetical protein